MRKATATSAQEFEYYGKPMTPSQIVERVSKLKADGIDYVMTHPGLAYDLS